MGRMVPSVPRLQKLLTASARMKGESRFDGRRQEIQWKARNQSTVINPPIAEVADLRGQKLTYSENPWFTAETRSTVNVIAQL